MWKFLNPGDIGFCIFVSSITNFFPCIFLLSIFLFSISFYLLAQTEKVDRKKDKVAIHP